MGELRFPRFLDIGQIVEDLYWLIKYGYRPRDLWSLDYWIAKKLEPAIRHLSETEHLMGYPESLNNQEEWRKILGKIADGFKSVLDEDSAELLARDFNGWVKGMEELEEKRKEGLELFATYFRDLWD